MAKHHKHNKYLWLAIALFAVLVSFQIVWFWQWRASGTVCHGVRINGINVGLLTQEEVKEQMQTHMEQWLQETAVTVKYEAKCAQIKAIDIASYDIEEAVDTALKVGREGSLIKQVIDFAWLSVSSRDIPSVARIDWKELLEELRNAKPRFESETVNAKIMAFDLRGEQGQRIKIKPGIWGSQLLLEDTAQRVYEAIMAGEAQVEAAVASIEPDITEDGLHSMDAVPMKSIRAFVSTEDTQAVVNGMKVTCQGVKPIVLEPQEVLSFKSYIQYNALEEAVRDVGVRIHIPSLLYECAARSELEIIEHHGLETINLPIYSPGQAALVDNEKDLIIKNGLDYPVIIAVQFVEEGAKSMLSCQIYRTPMKYNTHLKSVIKYEEDREYAEIYRVYTSEKGGERGRDLVDTIIYNRE